MRQMSPTERYEYLCDKLTKNGTFAELKRIREEFKRKEMEEVLRSLEKPKPKYQD